MHAPAKHNYPIIDAKTLSTFDAFLFGIPTRYGNFPGQWKVRSVRPPPSMINPWRHPFQRTDLLGYHRPSLDERWSIWKVCWCFYLDGKSWRRTGVDCYSIHVDSCPPRNHLYSVGLCEVIRSIDELDWGPWRWVLTPTPFWDNWHLLHLLDSCRVSLGSGHFCGTWWISPTLRPRARNRQHSRPFFLRACQQVHNLGAQAQNETRRTKSYFILIYTQNLVYIDWGNV